MGFELPRFERLTRAGRRGVPTAAGAGEQALADVLSQFSQQRAASAAQIAGQEAGAEGFAAGFESEELPQASDLTAAGRAYNQAAQLGHLARTRQDIKQNLGRLEIETRELPPEQWVDAYTKRADGLKAGLLEEAPPQLRGDIQAYFADLAGNARLKLLSDQSTRLQAEVLSDLKIGQTQLLDDISTAARELNQPLLAVRQREYEAMVNGMVDAGLASEAEGAVLIQDMHSTAVLNELVGAFDTELEDNGLEAGAAALDRFRRGDASEFGLSSEEKDQAEAVMTSRFNTERSFLAATQAQADAAQKAQLAATRQTADDTIATLRSGKAPETDVNALYTELVQAEDFNRVVDLANSIELYGELGPLLAAPPTESLAVVEQLEAAQSLSGSEKRLLDALGPAVDRRLRLLETDPRALAREDSVVSDGDLDFSGPDTLGVSLAARLGSSRQASQHYGTRVPPITEAEADQLGRYMALQEPDVSLAIARNMAQGLGADAEGALQLIDAKGYRVQAYAGGLAAVGDEETAAGVLRGQAILASQDGASIMPEGEQKAALDLHLQERLADAFRFLPATRQTATDAAMAWYADRAASEGDFTREFNPDRAEAAIAATVGNLVEDPSGQLNPLRNGTQDQFDNWLASLTGDTLEAAGAAIPGMTGDQLAERIRGGDATLIAVADGDFRVTLDNWLDGSAQFVLTDEGVPLELRFDPDVPQPERTRTEQVRRTFGRL